jgi:hypothetical protein
MMASLKKVKNKKTHISGVKIWVPYFYQQDAFEICPCK